MSTRSAFTKNKHRIRRTAHAAIIRMGILDGRRIVDAMEDHPLDFDLHTAVVTDIEAMRTRMLMEASKSSFDAYFEALDRTVMSYRV